VTPHRRFTNRVYAEIGRVGRALANPHRLELLDLLCQAPKTVERLATEADLSVTNASQHLRVLREANLVTSYKQGTYVVYEVADEAVPEVLRGLRMSAEHYLPDLERITRRFLSGREGLVPVDRGSLRRRVLEGTVTVVDVRPRDEYAAGHILGARSIPLPELAERLRELPQDGEIVAYCRGPYCVLAMEAVARLRASGLRATRLEDGIADWRVLGLPVAVGGAVGDGS
jgi:rhodanese-related sulfurtransferase